MPGFKWVIQSHIKYLHAKSISLANMILSRSDSGHNHSFMCHLNKPGQEENEILKTDQLITDKLVIK